MTEDYHEPTYSWLVKEGLEKSISLNPIESLKSKQKRMMGKRPFIIDNKG